jgi:hypothetical protein
MLESIMFVVVFLIGFDFLFFGKVFITYRLGQNDLRVNLFRVIPIMVVPLASITTIQRITQLKWATSGLADLFCSRVFAERLMLTKSSGFFKEVVITPDNPDQFIVELKQRVKERNGNRVI